MIYLTSIPRYFHFIQLFIIVTVALEKFHIDKNCAPPRGDLCIPIRKCPYFSELLDNSPIPRPRSVIQIIRQHQCGFLINSPKVCCWLNKTVENSTKKNISTTSLKQNLNKMNMTARDSCGVISHDFRITSGTETSLLEFPWMALIAYQTQEGLDFRCSGTVLNERYILTAAHCLRNLTFLGVRLGEYDINSKRDCDIVKRYCSPPVQDFYIENIILHPFYNPQTFENDIALVRLATPANFSYANVKPICLPFNDSTELDGKFAVVAGWGVTETGLKSTKLLKTSVPVIASDDCRRIHHNYASITSRQLCAGGYLGRDSCGGDSGGPLKYVTTIDGTPRYVQYGIVSYGPKYCGVDGHPGVYTKVSEYVEWILANIESN